MRITFRELFNRLDNGKKINGELVFNGEKITVHYVDGGWRLSVGDNRDLCMNMSSASIDTQLDFYENLGLGFARYYAGGDLPILALDSIAEASCATGFGGTSMKVAPLYVKYEKK